MGLQIEQVAKTAKRPQANIRLIVILWILVTVKIFTWQSIYWLAGSAEIAYIAIALFLIFTRSRANRVNGGIVLVYEAGTYLLNYVLGKFGIRVPHG